MGWKYVPKAYPRDLYHYGTKGMKWGERKELDERAPTNKTGRFVSDMSDEELVYYLTADDDLDRKLQLIDGIIKEKEEKLRDGIAKFGQRFGGTQSLTNDINKYRKLKAETLTKIHERDKKNAELSRKMSDESAKQRHAFESAKARAMGNRRASAAYYNRWKKW